MAGKAVIVIALLVTALGAPGLVDNSFAAPIPSYFADEWAGFLCVQTLIPGSTNRVNVLVQLNFDKITNGGITPAKADQLFDFLKTQISFFIGSSVTQTCALRPSQVDSQFHVNALQAALDLTGTHQQRGYPVFVILDSFWSLISSYLNQPQDALVLRSDVYLTAGSNNVSYAASQETLQSLLP